MPGIMCRDRAPRTYTLTGRCSPLLETVMHADPITNDDPSST